MNNQRSARCSLCFAPLLALLIGAAGGTVGAGTANAQERDDPRPPAAPADAVTPDSAAADTLAQVLETLMVRVKRPLVIGGSSAFEADLDSIAFLEPSATLADLLREMPLLRVRENSRGEMHVSLRGSESRQVPVLLDGTALTYGWDNRTDLSLIPLTGVRRVGTVRGLSSLLAGPNVLGGVMRLEVSQESFATTHVEPLRVRMAIDDGVGQAVEGSFGHVLGRETQLLLRGGGGYRRRDDLPIPKDIEQPPPAVSGTRLNSDMQQINGFLSARLQVKDGAWASLSSVAYTAERGVPPELHVEAPRLWRIPETWRWVTVLAGSTGWLGTGSQWRFGGSVGVDFGQNVIDVYASPDYEEIVGGEEGDDRTFTYRFFADHSFGSDLIAAAFTFADTDHDELLEPGGAASYSQRLWSGAVEFEKTLFHRNDGSGAAITLGGSLDGSDTPETGGRPGRDALWDWGAKVTGSITLAEGITRLHAGFSRRARFPSLRELYSGALGRFVPNPELGPETLLVGEGGVTANGETWTIQGVVFHQRLSDAVVRTGLGDGTFTRENRDRILSTGVELFGSLRWRSFFGSLDLTLQNVDLEDPSAPEDQRRPEYQPAVSGSLELGVQAALAIDTRLLIDHLGRRYCVNPDLGSDEELEASTSLGFQLWRDWSLQAGPLRRFRVLAALENLTNATINDQCGLPRPGRVFRIQVEIG
ncbi:MAG: TonB-dependent receptor [Gemmatimonadota bacterium]